MPDRGDRLTSRLAVIAAGHWDGVTLRGDAILARREEDMVIEIGEQRRVVPLGRLEGIAWRAPMLALWGGARGAVELTGTPQLESVARIIASHAFAFPELTRTLHALGSHRARPGADHDRFFDGLMRARRFAEETRELDARLAAFNGRRLSEGFSRAFQDFANARYPESAPDRRAMVAELQELAADLHAALLAADEAADAVRTAGDETRVGQWRAWTVAARRAFEAADRCWLTALPILDVPLARRRRLWRRMLFLRSLAGALAIGAMSIPGLVA